MRGKFIRPPRLVTEVADILPRAFDDTGSRRYRAPSTPTPKGCATGSSRCGWYTALHSAFFCKPCYDNITKTRLYLVVYLCAGVLVCWCAGMLVCWCAGVLVRWCTGVLVCWFTRVLLGVLLPCCPKPNFVPL